MTAPDLPPVPEAAIHAATQLCYGGQELTRAHAKHVLAYAQPEMFAAALRWAAGRLEASWQDVSDTALRTVRSAAADKMLALADQITGRAHPLIAVSVLTRNPDHYELHNTADGSCWVIRGGEWRRKEGGSR